MTIKEMRESLGMTQEMFSLVYNIPKRTIQNWESGMRKPPEYVIQMLQKAIEHDIPRTTEEIMRDGLTVTDLKFMCDSLIARGYGNKSVLLSNDIGCTGYHPMCYGLGIDEDDDKFATIE